MDTARWAREIATDSVVREEDSSFTPRSILLAKTVADIV
jgi:hypothetical protein